MDLTKLSGGSWNGDMDGISASDGSQNGRNFRESTVDTFLRDTAPAKIAQSVGDLLQLTRERQARQFIGQSSSTPNLNTSDSRIGTGATGRTGTGQAKRSIKGNNGSSSRRSLPGVSYTIQERPPNRTDIANLDRELESRVQAILSLDHDAQYSLSVTDLYDPHKDTVAIIRNKLLAEFKADFDALQQEPWLDRLIKCECIKITCDDIAIKLVDMVSVSSTELGHVLRKLRVSYKQTFDQMRQSWHMLRSAWMQNDQELRNSKEALSSAVHELNTKEVTLRLSMDSEIDAITIRTNQERAQDRAALSASEYKMEQMAETLQSLNGIFKNMQTDGTVTRAADMTSKCQRLEKENADLSVKCLALDKVKSDLAIALDKIALLEKEARMRDMELTTLKQQMVRREETVVALMEKESLRMAEIEKLKSIAGMQDEGDDFAMDFKEPATSVLCIKCKKGLDDITNIRAAVLGKGEGKTFQCESFRILLPNLRGRRPDRSTEWIRNCMRCIMIAKMREDVSLLSIKGEISRFPQFVYAWFDRAPVDNSKGAVIAAQFQSDDDRWGFYYGIKAAIRENDPEAVIFWSLLDETQGEDGMAFAFHCMSMALSMGGSDLWKQFGPALTSKCANINTKPVEDSIRVNIWLDLGTATEALKAILVRALKPHLQEAVEAIYALKVVPRIVDPQVKEEEALEAKRETEDAADADCPADVAPADTLDSDAPIYVDEDGGLRAPKRQSSIDEADPGVTSVPAGTDESIPHQEPTHISFFMWLRLLMQQVQAEQIHRAAAMRLMFESASVGALTPQLASASDPLEPGTAGSQLEYPQFQAICRTLFPSISLLDSANLYVSCYDEGRRKVTADVLLKVAGRMGLFSRAMRLVTLPLLAETVSAATADSDDKRDSAFDSPIVLRTGPVTKEDLLRSRLGALVHRKLAGITPDLIALAKRLPDRWRGMLMDARDQVVWALNDAYDKIKRSKLSGRDDEELKAKSRHFIDGIQPYVYYRRLLSVIMLVKSLSDNPLLPAELFLGKDRNILPAFDLGLRQAENLLSVMEESIVISLRLDSVLRADLLQGSSIDSSIVKISEKLSLDQFGAKGTSKAFKFEAARKNLVARKLQLAFFRFVHGDAIVPRCLRGCIRAGYLRGSRGVRARTVVNDPWWGQCLVADIYAFKIIFDGKAGRAGLPPIMLHEATSALLYSKWGSLDIVEREIHDLCTCVQSYQGSPRLRMFAAFIGQPCDLDNQTASIFQTQHAVSLYLNLVVEVHRELMNDVAANSTTNGPDAALRNGTDSYAIPRIDVLFPSAGNPLAHPTKRDYWMADGLALVRAVRRWVHSQRGLDEESAGVFLDLAEIVRGSSTATDGTVDVDDLLWVIMGQWAKFALWYVKRAAGRAAWNQTNAPLIKAKAYASQLNALRPKSSQEHADARQLAMAKVPGKESLPTPLSGAFLRTLVESLYRSGEGARIADSMYYTAAYIQTVAKRTARSSYVTSVMDDMLQKCALWDASTGPRQGSSDAALTLANVHHVCEVGSGTCGANSIAYAHMSVFAYKDAIKERLAEFVEMMKQLHSPELDAKTLMAENGLNQLVSDITASMKSAQGADLQMQNSIAVLRWAEFHDVVSSMDELIINFSIFGSSSESSNLFPQDRVKRANSNSIPKLSAGCYNIPLKNLTG